MVKLTGISIIAGLLLSACATSQTARLSKQAIVDIVKNDHPSNCRLEKTAYYQVVGCDYDASYYENGWHVFVSPVLVDAKGHPIQRLGLTSLYNLTSAGQIISREISGM